MGIGSQTDVDILGMLAFIVLLPAVPGVRRRLWADRLGEVRFSPQRQAMEASARRKLMLLLTATMLIGVGVFFAVEQAASGDGPAWAERFTDLGMLPFGGVLAGIAITLGLVYRVPRAHVYALLILAVFFAGHLMTNETPWRSGPVVLVACGAIVLIGGAIQLWRFSREFGPRTPGGLDA